MSKRGQCYYLYLYIKQVVALPLSVCWKGLLTCWCMMRAWSQAGYSHVSEVSSPHKGLEFKRAMNRKLSFLLLLGLALFCTAGCTMLPDISPTSVWPLPTTPSSPVTTTPLIFATPGTRIAQPTSRLTANATAQPPARPTADTVVNPSAIPSTKASAVPPTAPATSTASLTQTQLRYLIIARFGRVGAPPVFFCDSDIYPVARGSEEASAEKWLASVSKSADEYNSILAHLGLTNASLTPAQGLLIYREHKLLSAVTLTPADNAYQFSVRVSQRGSGTVEIGQQTDGTITPQGSITIVKQRSVPLVCPLCLSLGTRIDTPDGPVSVQDIRVGMQVWTLNQRSERIAASVAQVAHTAVPAEHQIVHMRLSDGRELRASPGHPTADGRVIGDLAPGDLLDGARVTGADREPYPFSSTYDLLPDGATGFYWANGVLVASTLR